MPKVSIILTTHGPAPYLKQAIGSVIAQTFEDWELIIANDGYDYSQHWGILDHRIWGLGFKVPEIGCRFAYTINQAFKSCKGEYITYLCHDDLYLPWRLERMTTWLGNMEKYGNCDVVFGYQRLIGEVPPDTDEMRYGSEDQPAGTVDHSSVMHRRECFEKAGGWDENAPPRYGDAYFWMRLQNAGYKFHCIPEVLDVHRFNRESITWKEDHPDEAKVPAL